MEMKWDGDETDEGAGDGGDMGGGKGCRGKEGWCKVVEERKVGARGDLEEVA